MSQFAIYLDEETAGRLDEASKKDGISRSAWVRNAIQSALTNRLPESFFRVLGTWEDSRSSDEILKDIRHSSEDSPRIAID